MIVSQDPAGEMPEPDASGNIVLNSQNGYFGFLILNGFALGDVAMWYIYRFDPSTHTQYPGLFVMAVMWSVFVLLMPLSIIYLIRGPASLLIDDNGIAWTRKGRRGKQISWTNMREIVLTSTVTTGRGQPIVRPNRFSTTQIKIISSNANPFRLPNFGITPVISAQYVLRRQNKQTSGGRAILTDNTIPSDISSSVINQNAKKKTSRVALYILVLLLAAMKISLIFFRNGH